MTSTPRASRSVHSSCVCTIATPTADPSKRGLITSGRSSDPGSSGNVPPVRSKRSQAGVGRPSAASSFFVRCLSIESAARFEAASGIRNREILEQRLNVSVFAAGAVQRDEDEIGFESRAARRKSGHHSRAIARRTRAIAARERPPIPIRIEISRSALLPPITTATLLFRPGITLHR